MSNPIRILHFVSSISKNSGVMSVIMNYYRYLDKNKVQFDFVFFKDYYPSYAEEINKMGGKLFLINSPSLSIKFFKQLNDVFNHKNEAYKALHLHEVYLAFCISPIAKKNGIQNIIAHTHTTKYSEKKSSSLRNRLMCIPLKKISTHLMSCSYASAKFWYGENSILNNDVYILRNAIDIEKFKFSESKRNEMRLKMGLSNKFIIGHVGRFSEPKNHVFIIKIFSEIYKKEKDAVLILIGDGPLRNRIEKLVIESGLGNNVLFLGTRNNVNDYLQMMDVLLLPSLYEGFPVIGLEAQAAGLPCIFSDSITDEVKLTDLAIYASLNLGSEEWAKIILNTRGSKHRSSPKIDDEYDIKKEAKKLEDFYLSL